MSVAASSMNHDQLMPGIDTGMSPKAGKSGLLDLEMFGSSNKPPRGKAKTVVIKELSG